MYIVMYSTCPMSITSLLSLISRWGLLIINHISVENVTLYVSFNGYTSVTIKLICFSALLLIITDYIVPVAASPNLLGRS